MEGVAERVREGPVRDPGTDCVAERVGLVDRERMPESVLVGESETETPAVPVGLAEREGETVRGDRVTLCVALADPVRVGREWDGDGVPLGLRERRLADGAGVTVAEADNVAVRDRARDWVQERLAVGE